MTSSMLFCVYFASILFINVKISEANSWRCDYTYVRKANGYFKYHNIPATWRDARLRCQLEGAILASPYPQVIHDSLLGLMKDLNCSRHIFTGVHATISKGDYYTIDGMPLSKIPIKWYAGEPDNHQNKEDCLILTADGFAADKSCDGLFPYFCYKEKKNDDDTIFRGSCGTTDRGYQYSEVTRSCYKFHTTARTWYRANMACSAEGGHLVVINSNEEADVIKNLYANNPDSKMVGNFRKDLAFVGFYDWNEPGDWRTIHENNRIFFVARQQNITRAVHFISKTPNASRGWL